MADLNYTPAPTYLDSLIAQPAPKAPAPKLDVIDPNASKASRVKRKVYRAKNKPYVFKTIPAICDSIQSVPNCIVWAVPFAYPNSYDFEKAYEGGNVTSLDSNEALEVQGVRIIKGVIQANVATSKRSHVSNLQVLAVDANNDYMTLLAPGDWLFCSMFTNPNDYASVLKRLSQKNTDKIDPINGFKDGLKFIGRVQTVRRINSTDPMTGKKTRRVVIMGAGFSEFDTTIYYDPALSVNSTNGEYFAAQFLAGVNQVITSMGPGMHTDPALRALIGTLMGTGPKTPNLAPGTNKIVTPNAAFNVPTLVGKLLGTTTKDDGASSLKYSSMLQGIYGIQNYDGTGFVPVLQDKGVGPGQHRTPEELRGTFALQLVPWINVPIWGVLSTFLMPTINEMYTCLRADKNGNVLPSFIARQIPFNTDLMPEAPTHPVTRFLNLPRWKVGDQQVITADTCKTNTMRCNFVQVKSQAAIEFQAGESISRALIEPNWDHMDVTRNGLCAQFSTTNNLLVDADVGAHWTAIVTDRSMGSHLKLSGQITTIGIQEPICEGDNLEYDDTVYHIEALNHAYNVNSMTGQTKFTTTIVVSNGVSIDGQEVFAETYGPPPITASSSQPATTLE